MTSLLSLKTFINDVYNWKPNPSLSKVYILAAVIMKLVSSIFITRLNKLLNILRFASPPPTSPDGRHPHSWLPVCRIRLCCAEPRSYLVPAHCSHRLLKGSCWAAFPNLVDGLGAEVYVCDREYGEGGSQRAWGHEILTQVFSDKFVVLI